MNLGQTTNFNSIRTCDVQISHNLGGSLTEIALGEFYTNTYIHRFFVVDLQLNSLTEGSPYIYWGTVLGS